MDRKRKEREGGGGGGEEGGRGGGRRREEDKTHPFSFSFFFGFSLWGGLLVLDVQLNRSFEPVESACAFVLKKKGGETAEARAEGEEVEVDGGFVQGRKGAVWRG